MKMNPSILIARCQEIQTSLGHTEIPEFDSIPLLGMTVRLALHIQGLPLVDYETLRLVAYHYLGIPRIYSEKIVNILSEIEFVRLQTEGKTIKAVLPTVPYYEQVYEGLGEYAEAETIFAEPEQLALAIVHRLAKSPENVDKLRNQIGAESTLFKRNMDIGIEGYYLVKKRCRGKDILINPTYFSENADIFADHVAASGAENVKKILEAIKDYQGMPLSIIEKRAQIGNYDINRDQIKLLNRIAQDGIVKPPSIRTTHSGENHFIFTPSPQNMSISPMKRDIYEKALAVVSAVRQGQFLAKEYAIRSPGAVLYKLKTELRLGKATTEFTQQYSNLVIMRIGRVVDIGSGYSRFEIIDTPENREALEIAYGLVNDGKVSGFDIDNEARMALQREQSYVESLISSAELRKTRQIDLSQESKDELADLLLRG